MFDIFFQNFNNKVPITEEEKLQIKRYLIPKKLRKKQYLLQEGDVCRQLAFIEKGTLKSYSIDEKGNERIIQFGVEGWVIADLNSFETGEPATYNIDAIDDSELILITKTSHKELLQKFPKYETFTRLNITGGYVAMQKRLTSIISASLEDRYTGFIDAYPDIAQRVPQHMIASYMGLTPETLSRLRQKMISK